MLQKELFGSSFEKTTGGLGREKRAEEERKLPGNKKKSQAGGSGSDRGILGNRISGVIEGFDVVCNGGQGLMIVLGVDLDFPNIPALRS